MPLPPKAGRPSSAATRLRVAIAVAALGLLLAPAGRAAADREHQVRDGQTLSAIARRYDVRVSSLAAANGLRPASTLRVGQVLRIPEQGVIYVQQGQTLSSIAHAHDVPVDALARANQLRATSTLQVGQRLVLPGYERAAGSATSSRGRWGTPRNRGVVSMKRVSQSASLRMRLVDARGRARAEARRRLAMLMEHRTSGKRRLPNPRLLQLLTTISDHFGGRRIYVISGYRVPGGYTRESSRHTHGDAIDIRVDGVPNTVLRDFCRTLPRTGCGFYPNSTFVHIDAREHDAYWVDWSRPGEAPRYRRAEDGPPDGEENEVVAAGGEDAVDPEENAVEVEDQDPSEGAGPEAREAAPGG